MWEISVTGTARALRSALIRCAPWMAAAAAGAIAVASNQETAVAACFAAISGSLVFGAARAALFFREKNQISQISERMKGQLYVDQLFSCSGQGKEIWPLPHRLPDKNVCIHLTFDSSKVRDHIEDSPPEIAINVYDLFQSKVLSCV